jgi:hypothetical protein
MKTEVYEHHGNKVHVNSELKGKHREICLCFACKKLDVTGANNCPIAAELYQLCIKHHLTTLVIECPVYEEK